MVPLSEDCGFIEWVPQTVTLRNVCTEVYAADGLIDMKSTLASVHSTYKNFSVRPSVFLSAHFIQPHKPCRQYRANCHRGHSRQCMQDPSLCQPLPVS